MSVFMHPIFRSLAEKNTELTVTLKNSIVIQGKLIHVDSNLNMHLSPATSPDPSLASMSKVFIRGSSVKFVSISHLSCSFELFDQLLQKEGEFV